MIQEKSQQLIAKTISIIVLICILTINIQPTPVVAQGNQPTTKTKLLGTTSSLSSITNPLVTASSPKKLNLTETPLRPMLMPSIILAPTFEMAKTLNFRAAGEGTYFRALVALHQPRDLTRLKEWNIKVLQSFNGYAYVMVDKDQLEKLAHSGFNPTEINSLDYMATVYNTLKAPNILSSQNLASSPITLMSLSGVDTDSDGLTDTEETWWCTDPNDNNSDSALAPSPSNPSDGAEVQAILNGVTAYGPPFALWPQFTPHNPSGNCPDGDYDSIPDSAEEFVLGTSILRESTDLDKFDDGQEFFGRTFCTGASGPCGYVFCRAQKTAHM
jgi:hypothetical protein